MGDEVFVQIAEALAIVQENMPLINSDKDKLVELIAAISDAVFPPA